MEIKDVQFKLLKDIFYGLAILVVYLWLNSGFSFNETVDEYLLITQGKITTKGQITQAEEFKELIESNDSRTAKVVNGYSYKYKFVTSTGQVIKTNSGNYGELPFDKNLNDIPYEVEVEYIPKTPEINRIKGLWSNNNDLFQWFKQRILLKLIGLAICLFFSYKFIKGGIDDYRQSIN